MYKTSAKVDDIDFGEGFVGEALDQVGVHASSSMYRCLPMLWRSGSRRAICPWTPVYGID